MRYRSETRFETYEPVSLPINYDMRAGYYKVPANGCNSICFMALPARSTGDDPFFVSNLYGVSDLQGFVPQVNGIPLFPTILNNMFEPGDPRAGGFGGINGVLTRLQPGDRLEFINAPGVIDETIYEVYHVLSNLGFRVPLMVIRRYLFPI